MSHHPPFRVVEATRAPFESEQSFHLTKTPQPDWKVGQGLNEAPLAHQELYRSPRQVKTYIPYENLSAADSYKLMINSVVPRPIALCSTVSADGKPNLAPYSYFNAVGHNPPTIMVSFCTTPSGEKDSALNIKATKEFVVAIISEPFIEAANYTSINTPKDVSEWTLSGLTPEPSVKVKPARVQESAINMECGLEHIYEMYDPLDPSKLTQTVIIGRIKAWHVKEEFLVDGGPSISVEKLMPAHRLGGISYGRTLAGYELPRPVWKDEKEKPEIQKVLDKAQNSS